MTYANLVLARTAEGFAEASDSAGASGLIVPDLPLEEAPSVLAACDAHGIALVPLVAPTTPEDRLAAIGARARGFVYTVSVAGTTGERQSAEGGYGSILRRTKAGTDVPVALGFGIGTPEQAAAAADAGADGVIVGSRLVREAADADDPPAAVRSIVAAMAEALRSP
jgi:tryptophan synthase alpha chain